MASSLFDSTLSTPSSGGGLFGGSSLGVLGDAPKEPSLLTRFFGDTHDTAAPYWVERPFEVATNLGEDIVNTATGIPKLVETGTRAVADDFMDVIGKGDDDDEGIVQMGKLALGDLWHTYEPLSRGDYGEFAHRVAEHPLGPILDALTVLTLGTAGVGTAGVRLGGTAGRVGAAAKNLEKVTTSPSSAAKSPDGKPLRVVDEGDVVTTVDGQAYAVKQRDLTTGSTTVSKDASQNYITGLQQNAFDRISKAFPELKVIGESSRAARSVRRSKKRENIRVTNKHVAPFEKWLGSKMGKKLRENPRELAALEGRVRNVKDHERVDQLINNRDALENNDVNLWQTAERNEIERQSRRSDLTPEDQDNLAKRLYELDDQFTKAYANKDSVLPQVIARTKQAEDLVNRPLTPVELARVDKAHELVKEAGKAGAELAPNARVTRDQLGQRAVGRRTEDLTDASYFPDSVDRAGTSGNRSKPGGIGATGQIARPSSQRLNTGYAYSAALNALDPANLAKSFRDAARYREYRGRWDAYVDSSIVLGLEDVVPDGFIEITDSRTLRHIENLSKVADEELPVIFGAENPMLLQMQDQIFGSLKTKLNNGQGRIAVPKAMKREMIDDVRKSNNALTKVLDNVTGFWRALTLNSRPAWLVNNIVGQGMLLMASHGLYGMIRGLMMTANPFDARMRNLQKEFVSDITGTGVGHIETAVTREAIQNTSIARKILNPSSRTNVKTAIPRAFNWWVERMGRINGILSDDIPRRAAFYEQIRLPAKRIQKQHPGLSFEDAARRYLDNPKNADRIAEKVLDDLVDFGDMSRVEREYVRRMVPFWSWIKGSSKRTARLPIERPGLTAAAYHVSKPLTEAQEGVVPEFMRGDLAVGEEKNGLQKYVVTQGINPFATFADLLGQGGALITGKSGSQFGPSNPMASTNPFVKGAIEAVANRDFFSGREIDPEGDQGFLDRYARRIATSTPITKSLETMMFRDTEYDDRRLFTPGFQTEALKYLGVPIREVRTDIAAERAADEGNGVF